MRKRIALLMTGTLLLVAALALAGCGSSEPQTATLTLPANPTTGYYWEVKQDPEIFDITSEYVQDEADEEMVGVGGTETFTLTPKEAGTTKITFTYLQPWEEGSVASELTYQVKVDEDMQITEESFSGEMPGGESEMPEIPELVVQ